MNLDLLDYFRAFNAKERFFLVGYALGNPSFTLSLTFRDEIDSALGLKIPEDHFCAMDFHLDWLYAGLRLYAGDRLGEAYSNDTGIIKGQQEDLDLLVGYRNGTTYHILIIEAKGVTSWTNKQMNSKAARLSLIFGHHGDEYGPQVVPHFLLMSPYEPQHLEVANWPAWMAPHGKVSRVPLQVPSTSLLKVSRCKASGKADASGGHWIVKKR